jgi:NAD/NADP transhydrogenase alpha subunit
MIVGVPKEIYPKERRVALVPTVIPNLKKAGLEIVVETGSGIAAGYPDAEYVEKGARLMGGRAELFQTADIIVQFLCYAANEKRASGNGFPAAVGNGENLAGNSGPRGDLVFGGVDATDDTGAEHGCFVIHGNDLRI